MKPVDQTITSGPLSDCLRACVASILEMASEEVPNFLGADEEWPAELERFCLARGLQPIMVDWDAHDPAHWHPEGYYIAVGRNRSERYHAVVGYKDEIVHDPSPVRQGIFTEEYRIFFLATLDGGGPAPRSNVGIGWVPRILQNPGLGKESR